MADPISDLPGDARRLVFAYLPLKFLSCEAVSKQLHTAAGEDEVWQQRCEEHWPSSNLGSTVATYRACFRSANGWSHLPALPRAVASVDPAPDGQRTSRRSAPVAPSICAFDASTHAQVCATSQRVRLRWAGQERTVEWADQPSLALADVKLLPGSEGDAPRALGLFRRGRATLLMPLGSDALPAPLWSSEDLDPGDTARAPFDELLMTDDAASVLLVGRRETSGQFTLLDPSIISLDLNRPAVTGRKASYSEGLRLPAAELRSACNDPASAPHQVTAAMKLGGAAARTHLRLPHTCTQTTADPQPSTQPHPSITEPPIYRHGTISDPPTGESRLLHYDLRVGPIGCQHTCMATGHANVRRVRHGTAGTPSRSNLAAPLRR